MSKIHNGHYVAAAANEYIGLATALLSSLLWEMGYALDRWLNLLNVALKKLPGVRHILKLRTIHLLEADFNTGTKHIFANRMMTHAQQLNQIPESQYAKQNSRAMEGVMLKKLFFDIFRIYKIPAAALNLDARRCYDRLALPIGS